MAEEIKNEAENKDEKETKVKLTLGQRVDKTVDAVKSIPKKIVNGGKKAGLAVGAGLLAAFAGGAFLGSKGCFTVDGETPALVEDGATVSVQSDVIDIEPEVVEETNEV